MEQITKYRADDGTEFHEKEKCVEYESLCDEILILMSRLPDIPDSCDFQNGNGHILHDEVIFMEVRKTILEISQRFCDHKWLQESIDGGLKIDPSWAGRMISECCPKPIYQAWHRISCTTNDFREFGQPYFRTNPNEAKGECLNN